MTSNQRDTFNAACDIAVMVGLLTILVLAALPLAGVTVMPWMRVTYAVAAGIVLVARLLTFRRSTDTLRQRRLRTLLVIAGVLICISAWLLFRRDSGPTDWIAFLMAGAVMQGYAQFMLDRIERKANNGESNTKKS